VLLPLSAATSLPTHLICADALPCPMRCFLLQHLASLLLGLLSPGLTVPHLNLLLSLLLHPNLPFLLSSLCSSPCPPSPCSVSVVSGKGPLLSPPCQVLPPAQRTQRANQAHQRTCPHQRTKTNLEFDTLTRMKVPTRKPGNKLSRSQTTSASNHHHSDQPRTINASKHSPKSNFLQRATISTNECHSHLRHLTPTSTNWSTLSGRADPGDTSLLPTALAQHHHARPIGWLRHLGAHQSH